MDSLKKRLTLEPVYTQAAATLTIPTDVMAEMASIGLSPEQAKAVAALLSRVEEATKADAESGIEAGRQKARDRWHKWDEKRRSNVSKRLLTAANNSRAVEDKTLTSVIEPQEQKASRTHGDVDAFRAGLSPDVSEEVIAEFVKVRRKRRGALTGYAAKLFREDADKCGMSVADAAKECVRSSWITVKPEYFSNRQRAGPPAAKPNPGLDAADALMEKYDAVSPSQTDTSPPYPRLVASSGIG